MEYKYTLRNQHKIKASLGSDFLKVMLDSLAHHFKTKESIEELTYENEKHKVIHVESIQPKTDTTLEFYVISTTYNVYLLAYKSCMG